VPGGEIVDREKVFGIEEQGKKEHTVDSSSSYNYPIQPASGSDKMTVD